MESANIFDEVLDEVEKLTPEEQEALVGILNRRIVEHGRKKIIADIETAQREFAEGKCKPASVEDIMNEIQT